MIVTRDEVKTLLNDSTLSNTLIDMLIPVVEQSICDYCNNDFLFRMFDFINSNSFTFLNSDNSINLLGLENSKLVAGDDIRIYGSLRNDGVYTIDSVTTDKIILNSINTITDEDENESIILTKVKYPISLKFTAAKMIRFDIESNNDKVGAIEEKIDDYSYKLPNNTFTSNYPTSLLGGLKCYRLPYKETVYEAFNIVRY